MKKIWVGGQVYELEKRKCVGSHCCEVFWCFPTSENFHCSLYCKNNNLITWQEATQNSWSAATSAKKARKKALADYTASTDDPPEPDESERIVKPLEVIPDELL